MLFKKGRRLLVADFKHTWLVREAKPDDVQISANRQEIISGFEMGAYLDCFMTIP